MKNILFLFFVLILFNPCSAQDRHTVDSLVSELKKAQVNSHSNENKISPESDTLKANILFQLSKIYYGNSPDTSLNYASQSLNVAQGIDFKKGMARAYNIMGALYDGKGDLVKALELYNLNLRLREEVGDNKGVAAAYNNIGVIYDDLGKYPEALKNYFSSLKIQEKIGDKYGAAASYNNIGIIYDNLGNYQEALKNYEISLNIRKEIDDEQGVADSYINIGVAYKSQGNYKEALKNYFIALKEYQEADIKSGLCTSYNNIGNIYFRQIQYDNAIKNYLIALKIATEIEDNSGIATATNNLGLININLKNYNEALKYLNTALKVAKANANLSILQDAYNGLATLDSAKGDYKKALEDYKLYILHRDSLLNQESSQKILKQQMQFDFDKRQVADSLKYVQQIEINRIKLQRQKVFTYGGLVGIAITFILLFFVSNNYKKQRIANRKLSEAQEQLIKSEKMAAFGLMASRLSHEIQNPLNFVNNFSEVSQGITDDLVNSSDEHERKQNADQLVTNLKKIKEHGNRAAAIIKQLQEHSIKGTAHDYFESGKKPPNTNE